MSTAWHCDVLVVGLGPAGARAAYEAARGGASVIAIDKRAEIGVPVQCAEFIPLPLAAHAQGQGVIRQRVAGMKSMLPSGAVEVSDFPGLLIDRAAFDQALAAEAAQAGAQLMCDTTLEGLDAEAGVARVRVAGQTQHVAHRVLVAADGPHSKVAALLGLPTLKTVHTRQYTVPLTAPYADTDIWLSNDFPGGYAWLFPKNEVANLGLGLDRRFGDDLKAPLDALHRRLVDEGRVGAEVLARTGGLIPVGGLRARLVEGRTLFAGDAAGLTHPITGAGIAAAVISGTRAGQAAAAWLHGTASAFDDFEEDVRDQFEASIARAVAVRTELERIWNTPLAGDDAMHRRGWIAFKDYFAAAPAAA